MSDVTSAELGYLDGVTSNVQTQLDAKQASDTDLAAIAALEFKLPENLKIIGTMNTADRSIALVDAALRRRFHFHGFFPDQEPIQGLLQRWLEDEGKTDLLWVADLVDAANSKLDERDLAIGPSHFMKDDLDEEKVQRIWKRSIMPYIEDHYFDNPDRATEFTYDKLRNNT